MRNLLTFFCAFSILVVAKAAEVQGRIDVSGVGDKIFLKPGNIKGGHISNAGWMTGEKGKQVIVAICPASKEWKNASFSFLPDKDGDVFLSLKGAWNQDKTATWTLFDDVKIKGAELQNGSFESGTIGWRLDGKGQKPSISSDAKEGFKSLKVAHDFPAVQKIKVKGGITVEISFSFKAAE